jgi:hypothetical protein
MSETLDAELHRRTWELLQPGEIDLDGLVVHTDLAGEDEPEMHQITVEVGEAIAKHSGYDPQDTFVYSGTDDSEFASNQHQGLTLNGEEFVWECQQLLRDGAFDIVFYYEASADSEAIREEVQEKGHDATIVRGDADEPADPVDG